MIDAFSGQPKKEHFKKAIGMLRKRGLFRMARELWPLRKVAV